MTIDLTRRTLLQLAGASSLAMAAAGAARAEGAPEGDGPTYASRTPMRVGMVTLRVKNLDKVADYYRDVIGLTVMERSATAASLGTAGISLLVLEARPDATIEPRNAAGLYHTAFLMPTRKDLARWLVAAASHRVPLSGFADHLVSESVYLDDPEGNGIEVYADRDPSQWQWSEGSVKMAADELNIPDLLSLTNTRVPDYAKAPDGLRIGHMHLRVGDLAGRALLPRCHRPGPDPQPQRCRVPVVGPLPSSPRHERLAEPGCRPTRRSGNRARLVLAGDGEAGAACRAGRAPAQGRRESHGAGEWRGGG